MEVFFSVYSIILAIAVLKASLDSGELFCCCKVSKASSKDCSAKSSRA
jgi:hypothetical protein